MKMKRSISTSESSDSAQVGSVRCGLAKRLFDAQRSLSKLPPRHKKKRQVKQPKSQSKCGLKQGKLSGYFVPELGPAKPTDKSSSDYEADRSSCTDSS